MYLQKVYQQETLWQTHYVSNAKNTTYLLAHTRSIATHAAGITLIVLMSAENRTYARRVKATTM